MPGNYHYAVQVSDTVFKRSGATSLRIVPNETIQLVRLGTTAPAIIYSDENGTVANSSGTVTTNGRGEWSAFLDPTYAPYQVVYKGQPFSQVDVFADPRESDYDLTALKTSTGLNQVGSGETIATREWIAANVSSGLTTAQINALIQQALVNSSAGTTTLTTAQINALIAAYVTANPPVIPPVDLTPFARFRGDPSTRDIVISDVLPASSYQAIPQVGTDGKIYFQNATLSAAPNIPVTTGDAVVTITSLTAANSHWVKTYFSNSGIPGGLQANIKIRDCSRLLEEFAVQADQVNFDLLFGWLEQTWKRTSVPNKLYGSTYTTASSSITDYTVDSGAMLTIFGALFRMWNLFGKDVYKTRASEIGSDLVNYCVISDNEGNAYLAADETNKAVTNGHHTFASHPYSMHEVGSINPMHFRAAKTFFGGAIWDQLIKGWYNLIAKMTDQNTAAPFSDFIAYEADSHTISQITSGSNGWTVTKSYDFGASAQRIGASLLMDKIAFSETRGVTALAKLVTFYAAKVSADGKVLNQYTRAGAGVGTTETTEVAYTAVLILGDASNSASATLRSAKIPANVTDSNGQYLPNTVKGVTAATTVDGDPLAWLALSKDQNRYVDIAKLGDHPSVGVLTAANGTVVTTPVVVTPGTTTGSSSNTGAYTATTPPIPSGTYKLLADPQTQAALYYASNGSGWTAAKKGGYNYHISRPGGFWISHSWGDAGLDYLRQYLNRCKNAGAAATILIYDMPNRDVQGGYSAGGQATAASYKDWYVSLVVPVCNEFPTVKKFIVAEPDSVPSLTALSGDARKLRADLLRWMGGYTTSNMLGLSGLYLDAGHPRWKPSNEIAQLLIECGLENFTGFAVNTSNAWNYDLCVSWAQEVRAIVGLRYHFTIDCGRNGSADGGTDTWLNPPNRQYGKFPQAGALGVDGLDLVVDWKLPGESDGNGGSAPSAGTFWPTYIWNDSLTQPGYNINSGDPTTGSGMAQRTPAISAATTGTTSSGQSGVPT